MSPELCNNPFMISDWLYILCRGEQEEQGKGGQPRRSKEEEEEEQEGEISARDLLLNIHFVHDPHRVMSYAYDVCGKNFSTFLTYNTIEKTSMEGITRFNPLL